VAEHDIVGVGLILGSDSHSVSGIQMKLPADTPTPPYFAVIFTSILNKGDDGYAESAERMVELATKQPGFLGFESARDSIGISVSYWSSLEAIAAWKANSEHLQAQKQGREWYKAYRIRVCRVEREYGS
jgi:heme-degrading monooxygenase HmoA